jgi:hypothetical protein
MSTITPTSDQRRTVNVTTFQIGDHVRNQQNRIGRIVTPQGVQQQAVPVAPTTLFVDVKWDDDGTVTTVALSTLSRASAPAAGSPGGGGAGGGIGPVESPPPPQGGPK